MSAKAERSGVGQGKALSEPGSDDGRQLEIPVNDN
jgi:hypothetical protein